MFRNLMLLAVVCLCLVLSACVSTKRLGQFTAASTNNVRNLKYSQSTGSKTRVLGKSCYTKVFGFKFGNDDDRLQRAMDDAIADGQDAGIDGDLLVNVRIQIEHRNYIVYGKNCMVVQADLVKVQTK